MNTLKTANETLQNDAEHQTRTGEEAVGDTELHDLCRARAHMYNLLARLCRDEVDPGLLEQMMGMLYPITSGNAHIDESSRLIAGYLSKTWEGAVEELAVDFSNTFIGRGSNGHSAAYPYESTYTSPKRLLMQGARDEVLAIYRSQGLDKAEGWRYSEDHISVELEFMERLCVRSANAFKMGRADAAEQLLRVQRSFLTDHLCAWVPMMAAEMKTFARTDFYLGVSHLLVGQLQTDLECVNELLGEGAAQAQEDAGAAPVETPAGDERDEPFEISFSDDLDEAVATAAR